MATSCLDDDDISSSGGGQLSVRPRPAGDRGYYYSVGLFFIFISEVHLASPAPREWSLLHRVKLIKVPNPSLSDDVTKNICRS